MKRKNVSHVRVTVQNLVQVLIDVLTVAVMEEYVLTKVFLQSNKHAPNAPVVVKK